MNRRQKISIWILVAVIASNSLIFSLPLKVLASEDGSTPDTPTNITFAQTSEQKFISDFLRTKNVSQYDIQNLLWYLGDQGFYKMTTAEKKAFLQKKIRERKLYYWQILPYVVQAEANNHWNSANQKNIDYFTDKCFADNFKKDAVSAAQFFVTSWCATGGKSNPIYPSFYDKSKWSASQLDKLYSQYWPNLAFLRYRPTFTEQELSNLKALVNILFQGNGTSDKVGAFCDKLSDPGLKDLSPEIFMMIVGNSALKLAGSIAVSNLGLDEMVTVGGATVAERAKLVRSTIGIAPNYFDDAASVRWWEQQGGSETWKLSRQLSSLAPRWRPSGLPDLEWIAQNTRYRNLFVKAATTGKIKLLPSNSVAKDFFDKHVVFIKKADYGASAPDVVDGKIVSPLKVNFTSTRSSSDDDIIDLFTHELTHFRNAQVFRSHVPYVGDDELMQILLDGGEIKHEPILEAITDYISLYSQGRITEVSIDKLAYGYPRGYLETIQRLVKLIMQKKHLSFDDAVRYLNNQYLRYDYSNLVQTVLNNNGLWYERLNVLLGEGNYVEAESYINYYLSR